MQHAKKLILLDPRELSHITEAASSSKKPQAMVQRQLNDTMKSILERPDISIHDQLQLYNQILHRFLQMEKQKGKEPLKITLSSSTTDNTEEPSPTLGHKEAAADDDDDNGKTSATFEQELIETIPKTLKANAKFLINNLKRNKSKGIIDWNDAGEMIFRGELIPGSNMLDLIQDSLRSRKEFGDPTGVSKFLEGLAMMNTPESLIKNISRRRILRQVKQGGPIQASDSPPPVMSHPTKSKGRKRKSKSSSAITMWERF